MGPVYCKVITPMFLAGADQNKPEIRAPSIRGALRWWFRAVAGGYIASHAEVRNHEQRLFGGVGDTTGTTSAVNVRLRANLTNDDFVDKKPVPRKAFTFKGIKPNTPFSVTFSDSPYNRQPHALDTTEALFNLAATLGGLGRRSRRGFGAFQPANGWVFQDQAAVSSHVAQVIGTVHQKVSTFLNPGAPPPLRTDLTTSSVAEYPIFHKDVLHICLGEPTDWDSFIKKLMTATHDFLKPPQSCLDIADENRRKQCIRTARLEAERVLGSGDPRQASTLLVSVVQVSGGWIVPIYTQFFCNTQNSSRNRADFDEIKDLPAKVSSRPFSVTTR